jgi:salicylate hydroxylase
MKFSLTWLKDYLDTQATVAEISAALKLYEAARIDRTARIVDESTEHAKLYHHDTAQAFRDAFAAKDPAKDRGLWLYNYDPLTVPLG